MKKLIYFAIATFFGLSTLQAQTFKVGATVGIPAADASDISNFVLGVDAYYYFTDIDDFINIGATVGFRNFFTEDLEISNLPEGVDTSVDDAMFLPIAAAARLKVFGLFGAGADIGYAIGLTDYLDGGFYFRPVVTFDIADTIELNASYESISDAGTWGNLNVGVLFEF